MNAENALKLARRFIELPLEKRRLFLDGLREEGVDFSLLPIAAGVDVAERDGLSYAQRRMWFLWQLDPQGAAYNLPMAVRLKGELDRQALQSAFDALIARHQSLRTRFESDGDDARQQVLESAPVMIESEDLVSLPPSEREAQLAAMAEAEALAPFDLAEGPLLRVRLLKLAEQEHVLLLTLHHIVADGWSLNLLIEEFLRLYDAACLDEDAALPALPVQYRDYAMWQRSWLEAGERERQLAYWRDKLGDEHAPLTLPTDRPHPAQPSHRGARHALQIDAGLAERLHGLARRHNVTLFMVLLAAFQLLLQRYSGQSAIRVGVPIANRQRAEVEGLIGCFINTQVLHTEIDPLIDVGELLRRVRETALGAQAHQELPFEQLVEALDLERSTALTPLFQVLFNHQPTVAGVGELKTRSGLTLARVETARVTARFDLTLDTYESAGRLHAAFTYSLDVFEEPTVVELGRNWLRLLEGLVVQAPGSIGELPLEQEPSAPEQGCDVPAAPAVDCVHHLIERAANQHPQRLAATSGDGNIGYARLNERADEVARVLLAAGVQPDQRIGVVGDRSIDMLVGILGILKAGAAYLPLEPEQPQERLEFMLADSDVSLVLGRSSWNGSLPPDVRRIDLDQPLPTTSADAQQPVRVSPDNLAYVIYTSGTTGTPKGVAVPHGALVNYVEGISRRLPLETIQSMAMVSTPAADLGHTMLYGALCAGKTLHLLDKETMLDAEAFAVCMEEHAVDALKIVPSHLAAMLSAGRSALPRHCLILGGEACPPALLDRIADLAPELTVLNHYGPTETTVGVLAGELKGSPVLGSPLDNTSVRVLDSCLQPAPGSARGELYISGTGLSRGYLGRPALTAERFVPDPVGIPGARMYRTGDWVRRNSGGELLFAGRMDGQVKIRGYRVELAEIESRLRALPGVGNALVRVVGEEPARQLAAYLVPTEARDGQAQQAFADEVRAALKRALPEHMVPAHLLVLERLPVTANGKVDLKALPEPVASSAAYVAPVTPLQKQLAEIWAEVLQGEQVGLSDNFFALGGHSLLATQVVSRARKRLGLDIPLRTLFDTADLQAFADAVKSAGRELDAEIEHVDRDSPLPVSHAQHRQWLFWKLNPESTAYNTPLAVRMRGELDRQALQVALDALVARHESLRTVFHEENGLPWQRILLAGAVTIGYEDLSGQDEAAQTRRLEEEAFARFDLEQGPLIRARLFRVREDKHLLAVTLHHIVSDGWSMSVMVREFAAAYNARSAGQVQELQPLPVQYADYASWQRQRLAAGQMQTQLAYWKAKLEDDFDVLELPADRIRPQVQSYRGGRVDIRLPDELAAKLRRLAVEANATLFHVFLAAFAILLSRYSGRDKINVGVPITNRNRLELEGLIGFFVNTIVARMGVDPATTFSQLLETVKETALEAQANKDIPFDVLVEELKPERGLEHNPLFQVMYNHLRDFGEQVSADSLRGLHVEEVDLVERSAHFDISLNTLEQSDGLVASFNYSSDLFEAERIERLAAHWHNLLEAICAQPEKRVAELPMLGESERQFILAQWDQTQLDYPSDRYVHQLIEDRARQTPDAVAVIFGDQQLTYGQLDARANRLAHRLIELGVGPEVRVAIAMRRSAEIMVAFLAVLKAGGAYVPLDVAYPQDRLLYMMKDCAAALVLTQSDVLEQLPIPEGLSTLAVDRTDDWQGYPDTAPVVALAEENLAYVIYTSGSTGQPKGVAVSHGPLVSHIRATGERYETNPSDCELHFMSFAFDGAHEGWMHPLINGARVLVRDDSLWLPEQTYAEMHRHGVTLGVFPPVYLQQLAEHAERDGNPPPVRVYCFGGDAVPQASYDLAWRALRPQYLFNGYGPTETVVTPLLWKARKGDACGAAYAPIGTLLGKRRGYVLDADLNLLPVGLAGELYLGGEGVARGYLDRPALTAERFVPDPFDSNGERVYRSGDLTRARPNGLVDYLGRVDHQVKVRGFRIELGEIEARLLEQEAVREAVVLAQDGASGRQLVGYVVPTEPVSVERQGDLREELRVALKKSLPDYMVPTHLLFLDSLPLTPNGKLDRKVLPQPDTSQLQQAYVAPRTELEQQIAAIWQDVLKLERVGLTDNFFELGGDSIISLQVVSRARQTGIQFTPKDLFQHQTVQGLAAVAHRSEGPVIDQGLVSGSMALTPIQHWFFEAEIPERHHWNQSVLLKPREQLDPDHLRAAFQALVEHHDALRLRFEQRDGAWQAEFQSVEPVDVLWTSHLADLAELEQVANEAQRSLNLENGPLLRAVLAELPDDSQRLLLVIHHLVVDGVSWRVLLEDLQQTYQALDAGQLVRLPAKTSSFKAWAEHLQVHAESSALEGELAYWKTQLQGTVDELPCDHQEGGNQQKQAAYANTRLDRDWTCRLLQEVPAAYRSQINDLLLTALARVIARWTGQPDVLVRLEGHGREDLFEDIDLTRTVGWFTSMYPVKLSPQVELSASIKTIKEQLRAIPNKGIGYGLLRYLGSPEARQMLQRLPQGEIVFNYLGQFDGTFDDEASLFVPAKEGTGATQDEEAPLASLLALNGQVYEGELSLGWTFSREVFNEQTIQRLADEYVEELKVLIEHCCDECNRGVTPSDFPLAKLSQKQLDCLPIPTEQIADIYPLSPMQQGMLFHSLYEQEGGDYINQVRVDVEGLDIERFREAWQSTADSHEVLRANFISDLAAPLQVVRKHIQVPFMVLDWRGQTHLEEALTTWAQADRQKGFDCLKDPLLRLTVIRTAEHRHHLIYTNHHILMDGWSNSRLLGEVLQRYAGQAVPSSMGRYRDYIAWLQRQDQVTGEAFWKEQLVELEEPTRLVQAVRSDVGEATGYGDHYQTFGQDQTHRLEAFARAHHVTLNTLVQSAWLLLLQRYTGQESVCFGATVAGRPAELAGVEEQIGLFINTLPVIGSPRPEQSVVEWVEQVQARNLALREFEHTPLYEVQRWAGLGGEALFASLLVFENYPVSEALQQGAPAGLRFGQVVGQEQTNYPLTLAVGLGETLTVHYGYDRRNFDAQAVARLAEHFGNLLRALTVDGQARIGGLPMLGSEEYQQLVHGWNRTEADFPRDACIHQLIEAQVEKTPEATALIFGEQEVSYRELNRRANRLAHKLRELGVGSDVLVGIAVERSLDMVVGLLAILKAGGAYVPLDPEYPQDRLAYMLEDSQAILLLSQSSLQDRLPLSFRARTLLLDQISLEPYPDNNPLNLTLPGGLAYSIYTSGSTGRPKGVLIEHRNAVALIGWALSIYSLEYLCGVLASTSICFDLSVWELFVTLSAGGYAVLAGNTLELPNLSAKDRVRLVNTVPSAIKVLCEAGRLPDTVRTINLAGEALKQTLVDDLYRTGHVCQVYDLYGPSEDTTYSTYTLRVVDGRANIGRPISNSAVYLLDGVGLPVPVGALGELYMAGAGLARGYLGRPALTAEKFLPNPFDDSEQGGGRLYRTGDLARYRPDGVIEYVGRIDHQVKIRGFRIELGEIEARLLKQDFVREAVVLDQEGLCGKQLVGYVVPMEPVSSEQQSDLREVLRAALKESLPEYMVPAHLLFLDSLPLTPNGKLDRKALPQPDASQLQQTYVVPRTELEQQIAAIWQDVLKLGRVGLTDNFFELGGDSIISLQVVSRASQAGIQFTPKDLFQHQTVQALAAVARQSEGPLIDQGPVTGYMPLTPIQRWFFESEIPERQQWNQSLLLTPRERLEPEPLSAALQALVAHHDSLRLRFVEQESGWQAEFGPVSAQELLWVSYLADVAELEQVANEAQRSLSLENGPLLRAVLAELPDGTQRLLLAIHHLVVDGVSWRVLLEDLQQAYRSQALPAKTSAFKAWAERLQAHAATAGLAAERDYWQGQLQGVSERLPCDYPDGGNCCQKHAAYANTRLDRDWTRRLLQETPAAYRTQVNDLLLTALARVIARWSGESDVLVRLEGHGREALFDDLDVTRTVGWFTSLYPVKLSPQAELSASIKTIKEQLRGVPNKGLGYGLLKYLADEPLREAMTQLPQGSIVFNYLGQFDGSFDASESLFTPAQESTGATQSPEAPQGSELTLNGQVYDGELSLVWSYSRERFDEATIQRLAEAYRLELETIIAHCTDETHRGVTPSDFSLAGLNQAQLDRLPVAPGEIADLYPLSPMQQGMLFHTLYEQGGEQYINQLRVDVEGLDVERFQQAWQTAVEAHDVLRSQFIVEPPLQIVRRHLPTPFETLDWRGQSNLQDSLSTWAQADRQKGFDLAQGALLRLTMVRTAEQRYHLIYTSHHILMDGWSNSRLLGEVLQRYAGQVVASPNGRYRDYIAWLQRQDAQAAEHFWKAQLVQLDEPTRLAQVVPGEGVEGAGYSDHLQRFDAGQTLALQRFAQQHKVTVNTLVQSAWLLLLQRYSGQESVCFGATVAGRPAELVGVEEQIGLFINTLPVIGRPRPEQTVAQWLAQVQASNLALREFEHTPLYEVQRWAGQGGEALFDSLLVFENYPVSEALQQGAPAGLRFGEVSGREQTNYPLTLGISLGETLTVQYGFDLHQFDAWGVARLAEHFGNLLWALVQGPQQRLGELSLLGESERRSILSQWDQTGQDFPGERPVHRLIEDQARKAPDAVAVIFGEQQLSYGELDRQANRLAHRLIELGVGPEVRVAIAMPRSAEIMVAFLAVLKAGGAYVPLDVGYPQDRMLYMMKDCAAALVLTHSEVLERLPIPEELPSLAVDLEERWHDYPASAPEVALATENLAYVIYTSGSTGQPKGVAVAHGPLVEHVQATGERYEMSAADCELNFMSFAFDGAHEGWMHPLINGARILVRDDSLWLPERTYAEMHEHGVTVGGFPPVYLQHLAEYAERDGNPPPVRVYCVGGDAVSQASFELACRALRPQYLLNGYGPTETVVTPLLWKAKPGDPCGASYAPIGTLLGKRRGYLLDAELNLLPVGLAGELYLGGGGVARGYLDRPGLTAERFVPDPFGDGERVYRSGDLTRARPDGVVDYLGRVDHQVKVRGFRIELGEIEARLLEQETVREAVVLAQEGASGKQLVGYVVPVNALKGAETEAALRDTLRSSLRTQLPEYMVPTYLLFLDSLPLTPNGKLDRKALPLPDISQLQQTHVAPRTELERQLAAIWQSVLKLEQVGLTDNFFELGGDSIISLQVVSRARQAGIQLTPKDLFQHQTVQALAAVARQ
ncbi:non-ribosomal peptide synthase/polyketide synthase, partial [Pseudomonas lopnurensis]|uniref:non-ribosomal peptide synthase/polyketide synthase n=1 Tax=Pseudomonas lopnurensis TaxID=1477517 RepID=UPI00187AE2B2